MFFTRSFFKTAGVVLLSGVLSHLSAETISCSYYSANYNGRRTANGQIFSNSKLTAASRTLPFGTKLKLTNPKNGHSVIVRVNDRGPNVAGRDLSITHRAAQRLHILGTGVAKLEMDNLSETGSAKVK